MLVRGAAVLAAAERLEKLEDGAVVDVNCMQKDAKLVWNMVQMLEYVGDMGHTTGRERWSTHGSARNLLHQDEARRTCIFEDVIKVLNHFSIRAVSPVVCGLRR